jgi:hypothetical protein
VTTNDPDLNQISGVRIKSIMVPNSQYNVNSSNATLYMTQSHTATTDFAIAEGQYTTTTLISALQTVINADIAPATMTITQDTVTQKLLFTFSAGTFSMYNFDDGNDMAKLLGILISSAAPALTFTSFGVPDLIGLRHVFIVSNSLTGGTNLISQTGTNFNMLGDILVDVPFGEYVMREFTEQTTNHFYYNNFRNTASFDISLVAEGTTALLELNGLPWTIVLECFSSGA